MKFIIETDASDCADVRITLLECAEKIERSVEMFSDEESAPAKREAQALRRFAVALARRAPASALVVALICCAVALGCAPAERWQDRPESGPDTVRTVDRDGRPSWGPMP